MASDIGAKNCPWDNNERQEIMWIMTIRYHQANGDVRGDGDSGFLRDHRPQKGEEPRRA